MNSTMTFDNDELMHLALYSAENETPDKTISYLKQLLAQDPENGAALYFMGAMHAEIKMYSLAIEEISRALELNPDLPPTAPFQLGQLLITSGEFEQAQIAWQALDKYGEDDPYYIFKTAMLDLVNDQFEEAISGLRKGIEINTVNAALNQDMQQLLENTENTYNNDNGSGDHIDGGQRMLLSIYEDED